MRKVNKTCNDEAGGLITELEVSCNYCKREVANKKQIPFLTLSNSESAPSLLPQNPSETSVLA